MRNAYRTTASAVRAASFAALSALVSIGAVAAAEQSTDFYASYGLAASFGARANTSASPVLTSDYSGSTEAWGVNGFRASFGGSNPVGPSTNLCGTGSTDTWGVDGFLVSFGPPASRTAGDLAQACQGAGTVLR